MQFKVPCAFEHKNRDLVLAVEGALTAMMKKEAGEVRVLNIWEGNKSGFTLYTVAITVFMDKPLLKAGYQLHL
jgi:hypothetical protein